MISRKSADLLESAGKFGTTRDIRDTTLYFILADYPTLLFIFYRISFCFVCEVSYIVEFKFNIQIYRYYTYLLNKEYTRQHLPQTRASVTYLPHIHFFASYMELLAYLLRKSMKHLNSNTINQRVASVVNMYKIKIR